MIHQSKKIWLSVTTFIVLAIMWLLVGWAELLQHSVMPTLPEVLEALHEGIEKGFLWQDLSASLSHTIPGMIFGTVFGIVVGLVTGRSTFFSFTLGTTLHVWRALPLVATTPLLIKLIGISWFSKVFIIGSGQFIPTWIATHVGVSVVSIEYIELAEVFGFSQYRRFRDVILPSAASHIISGIRTGIGASYIMLFVSEWIVSNAGIGYRIGISHLVSRGDIMVLGLLQLGFLAYLTDLLVRWIAELICPWISIRNE